MGRRRQEIALEAIHVGLEGADTLRGGSLLRRVEEGRPQHAECHEQQPAQFATPFSHLPTREPLHVGRLRTLAPNIVGSEYPACDFDATGGRSAPGDIGQARSATKSPLLPPRFSRSRSPSIRAVRSKALEVS